mgnify:FL=1
MATYNTSVASGDPGPFGLRTIRMSDGSTETVPNTPIFIKKLIVTHADAADNFLAIKDLNGYLFKIFLHQADLREVPGIEDRRNPGEWIVPPMQCAFTTQSDIIDFPEPGLRAEGNISLEAGINGTTESTIYYTYASNTPDPTP